MIVTVTPNPVLDRTLTVDHLELDTVLRATDVRLDWGGKGFNVSRALQAVETPSVAMGFLGGATGDLLEEGLGSLGLICDFVRIAGETRTNVVVAEPGGHHLKVNERGPVVNAAAQARLMTALGTRLQPGDICVVAGSLPPGVSADFYGRLIRLIAECGAYAVLDASGEALQWGLAAGPELVKPNGLEAAALLGRTIATPEDAAAGAAELVARGAGMAAISLGPDGLVLAGNSGRVYAQPPAIQEAINVGAGDATVAGLIWAWSQRLELAEIARWGVAFGTAAAAKSGVTFGTHDELHAMHAATRVRTH